MAKKKFMIGVDCEGVACVVGSANEKLSDSRQFAFARAQATREADAAAKALFDAGADTVVVWDNHGGSLNLDYDALDPRCRIALGRFPHRWPGLDETYSGVLFIGYHAMSGIADAPLSHSFSSGSVDWMKVNGHPVGELAIDSALAGEKGVPAIFLASDDKAVSEFLQFAPHAETVETKVGYRRNGAISLHPRTSVGQIAAAVCQAAQRADSMTPYRFESPVEFRVRFQRVEHAENRENVGWSRLDGQTVAKTVASIAEIY